MSNSVSSEKLQMLCDAVRNIPKTKLAKVKSFSMDWKEVGGNNGWQDAVVVPVINVTFKD